MNNKKMLYFERIDVSEVIDVNKRSASKKCDICHYWHLWKNKFQFQPNVCNRCHDFVMSMNLSKIAILNIEGSNYHFLLLELAKVRL